MPAEDLVWYVSYGSNLLRQRFLCYIEGGLPEGSSHTNPGCSDRTPPRDDRLVMIPHPLVFAEHSTAWGGAVAFVQHRTDGPPTYARAWLITWEQFEGVLSQENKSSLMRLDRTTGPGWQGSLAPAGWYSWVIALQDPLGDGRPAFTFTSPEPDGPPAPSPPSPQYLDTLRRGLLEMRLDPDAVERYLEDRCQNR